MRRSLRPVVIGLLLGLLGLLGATLAVAAPGCSVEHAYDLRTTARALPDGRPLSGVRVELQAAGARDWPASAATAEDGTLSAGFKVSAGEFHSPPTWRLLLSKDGYHDEAIDISPRRQRKAGAPATQLVVVAYLRPKTPQ